MIVENKLTPLTREQAAQALSAAYRQLMGALPTAGVMALLLAQSALETGNWQKIHNFNFGNAKAGVDYPLIVSCGEVRASCTSLSVMPPMAACRIRTRTSS